MSDTRAETPTPQPEEIKGKEITVTATSSKPKGEEGIIHPEDTDKKEVEVKILIEKKTGLPI